MKGRTLRRFAALLLTLMALLSDNPVAAAEPCQLTRKTTLPMVPLGNTDSFTVPAMLGRRPMRMLFDTGAKETVLEGLVVQQAGYHPPQTYDMRLVGVGGEVSAGLSSSVLPLILGNILRFERRLATEPTKLLYGNRFDGLLGADLLFMFDFEVDPSGRKINIFSPDHCPGQVVYWADEYGAFPFKMDRNGAMTVDVKINGRALRGVIDTGNSQTSMTWKAASDLFGLTTTSPGVYAVSNKTQTADGRALDAAQTTFDTLEFGDLKLHHAVVNIVQQYSTNAVTDLFGTDGWQPQLLIGMDVMKRLRFYVASGEKMVYFTLISPPT